MSDPGTGRRRDLVTLALIFALAAGQRLAWTDLLFNEDWEWIFRFVGDWGATRGEYALFLYSSMPAALFSLVAWSFDGPMVPLRIWALLGSLGAPLLYLALRRVVGWLPSTLAALALALSVSDAHTAIGLRTPYLASTFVALGLLGLVAGYQKRWWGPPLLAGGMAAAVGFHLGLWPLAIATCVVLVGLLVRLGTGRLPALSWMVTCLAGGTVVGLVAELDGAHLASDLQILAESVFPPGLEARPDLEWAATYGLGAPTPLLAVTGGACLLGLCAWLPRLHRAKRAGDPHVGAGVVGLLASLLLVSGATDFARHAVQDAYLWYHHLVPLQPLLLVALVGAGAGLLPEVPSRLERGLVWSLLVVWVLQAAAQVPGAMAERLTLAPTPTRSLRAATTLATAIGDHAWLSKHTPALLWLDDRGELFDSCLEVKLVEALAQWPTGTKSDSQTYAVMPRAVADGFGWYDEADLDPALPWAVHTTDSQRMLFQETRGRCPDLHHQQCARCRPPAGASP